MKRITYAAVAAIALTGFVGLGCEREDTTASRTTTTTTGGTSTTSPAVDVDVDVNKDKLRSAADRTGDAVQRGVDKTGDALSTAADKTRDVAKDVGGRISDTASNVANNAKDAGARVTAGSDAEGIRDVLAQVSEAALTKGGLDDLVERFVDGDRNRLGQGGVLDANHPELDGRIDQFLKDWQAKYRQEEFDITNEEAAFPDQMFKIAEGEIGRGAAGASVDVNRTPGGNVDVDVDNRTGVDRPDSGAADANRNDPGRNIARVQVAQSGNMPALTVPMVHEAPDRWKIDVPDTLTAEKLRANLLTHLTKANEMKDQWPADVNQAQAMVSHHVLMAVLDKPAK